MRPSVHISGRKKDNIQQQIARRFDDAARTYDEHSYIQRHVATRFANSIASFALPPNLNVLEIGCGTGHLTEGLAMNFPDARIVATDISPSMLRACRNRLGVDKRFSYVAMDGTKPTLLPNFDLVCSSLALQWFPDLAASLRTLAKMLVPGGTLCVTLLGARTFHEWRDAHLRHGLSAGSLEFLSMEACEELFPKGQLQLCTEQYVDQPSSILEFLRALRAIGADTPVTGHTAISPGRFRKVLREFEGAPQITYEVIYAYWNAG